VRSREHLLEHPLASRLELCVLHVDALRLRLDLEHRCVFVEAGLVRLPVHGNRRDEDVVAD